MGQRIKDLGAVGSTPTLDRADADLFKMSISANVTITLSNFEDGDIVTFSIENTSGASKSVALSNTVYWEVAEGGAPGVASGVTLYLTLRAMDGVFIELSRSHS